MTEPEHYVTGTGERVDNVHSRAWCWGPWCVIHNPAPGPWQNWPTHWIKAPDGADSRLHGIMTRICDHGFAHPCVEDVVAYGDGMPYHACDGCPCDPEYIGTRMSSLPSGLQAQMPENPEGQDRQTDTDPPQVDAGGNTERGEEAQHGGDQVQEGSHFRPVPVRPRDYAGKPAIAPEEMTLKEKFLADQLEANVEEVLARLVTHLVFMVVANGGNHPGRSMVPTAWFLDMEHINGIQAKGVLQGACWHLAEVTLVGMERDGTLEQQYGVRLGEGFERDEQ